EQWLQQYQSLNNTLYALTQHMDFNRVSVIDATIAPQEYYAIRRAQQLLHTIAGANGLVVDIFVTFRNNDVILTVQDAFDNREAFERFYQSADLAQNMISPWTYDRSLKFFPACTLDTPSMQPTRTIPYRFSYGVCVIYVLLDERTLLQSFLPARFAQDGFVWLTDGEGKLLAASDDAVENTLQGHAECSEQRYKGKQHLVIQATCDGSPLQILCGLPTQSFVQGFAGQLQLMGLYLVFALGVGVLLAMILAHQQTWPLRSVVRELISLGFDVRDARQTYEHMKNSLYAMQRKEQNFSTQLVQYRTQLQEMTLERLLISGEIGDTLSTASRTFLDALPASYLIGYGCMVVAGEGGQTPLSDSLRMLFEEQLRHGLAEGAYLHSMGQSFFALILPCRKPEEQAQAVEQVRNQLCMLMQKLPVRVTLGISACEKGVECMHAAYEQARLVYTLGNGREGALVATDVLRDDVPNVDMQNLMQLYRALAAGDEALARQQVHLLYGNPVLLSQGLEQAYHTIRSVLYWAYMSTLPQTTTLDWPAPGASCAPE
ncbi:MAG: hypothetical protein RR482_07625, partial [Clostridia bacterium]